VFFNLFWLTAPFATKKKLAAPLPVKKMTICSTLSGKTLNKTVKQTFGGTPDTSSQQPGWESM